MRVTGRTAYVAQGPGSRHAAGLRENGMVLSAFALAKKAGVRMEGVANVDKLANYVAQGGGEGSRGTSSLMGALGLVDYDDATGSRAANCEFEAMAGVDVIYTSRLVATGPEPRTWDLPWSELPVPTPPLLF